MFFFLDGIENLQLDIVGFLAILGEGSVLANQQVSTLSWLIVLPRLLPAPQVFIRTSRPSRLRETLGMVMGTHSGNARHHINHIAHLLHGGNDLPPFTVKCVRV